MDQSSVHQIYLELSTFCNAKCPHCPRFAPVNHNADDANRAIHPNLKLQHINLATIKQNLQVDQLTSLSEVILMGDKGDPCMNPDVESFIDLFAQHKNKPLIILNTNGSIRNADWWANLAKKQYENLLVTFSIDGLADTNHLYRIGLNFNTIMNNVRSFIDNGGQAEWKFLVFEHNQHQVDEAIALSKKLGFKQFESQLPDLTRFQGKSKWPIKIGSNSYTISPPDTEVTISGRIFFRTDVNDSKRNSVRNVNFDQACPYLRRGSLYITGSHHVVPCCMMHFDIDLEYFGKDRLLNLTGGNFDSIDLSLNTLETLLGSKFYNKNLQQSFISGDLQHNCLYCKSEIEKNLKWISSNQTSQQAVDLGR